MIPKLRNCQNLRRKLGIFEIVWGICCSLDKKQISKWQNWPRKQRKCCTKVKPVPLPPHFQKASLLDNVDVCECFWLTGVQARFLFCYSTTESGGSTHWRNVADMMSCGQAGSKTSLQMSEKNRNKILFEMTTRQHKRTVFFRNIKYFLTFITTLQWVATQVCPFFIFADDELDCD